MSYKFGNFVWFECVTDDIAASKAFYTETLGWKANVMEMGEGTYTMLGAAADKSSCGVINAQMDGVPNQWTSYVSVDDVDAAAQRVRDNGGEVIVPPRDIPTIGRFSLVKDPEGATFNLFKGEQGDDNAAADFHWNELYADDIDKLAPFYEKVLGYKATKMDMPNGGTYTIFKKGDKDVAGGMTKPEKGIPSMWLPYVGVSNCDEVIARAKKLEAEVKLGPIDAEGIGRFAVLLDNRGAAIGVIQPAK